MAFQWKGNKDIWKGEGIYHLTFVVSGRRKLLGEVKGVDNPTSEQCPDKDKAWVELSPLGKAIDDDLRHFQDRHEGTLICARKIMDDHIHVVVWVQKEIPQSIRQIGHGFQIGITHIAKELGVWPPVTQATYTDTPSGIAASGNGGFQSRLNPNANCNNAKEVVGMQRACDARPVSNPPAPVPPSAGLILEQPFIRTLSHRGQLHAMIEYVQLNPYRRWMRRLSPELFTMHRDTCIAGLTFRSMGNHWLLNWPVRQKVQCSRSISEEALDALLKEKLAAAELGAVTYSAAVSKGEQFITRKIREAGWPVVILLNDGFPLAGSDSERYYKPGGIYFNTCMAGKLLLLEACPETYENPEIVASTDKALLAKACPLIPHQSQRWRFMAGNEIIRILSSDTE